MTEWILLLFWLFCTDLGKAPDGRGARGEATTQPGAVLTAETGQAGKGGPEKVGCLFMFSYLYFNTVVEYCQFSAYDIVCFSVSYSLIILCNMI